MGLVGSAAGGGLLGCWLLGLVRLRPPSEASEFECGALLACVRGRGLLVVCWSNNSPASHFRVDENNKIGYPRGGE